MSEHNEGQSPKVESDQYGSLLDHEYDGIREYDNPTPGWWHALFLGSVVFSLFYAGAMHLSEENEWSPVDRLEKAKFAANQLKFGDLPDDMEPTEANLLWFMADEDKWMSLGAGIFKTNCAQCHAGDGGGINGPNLTDDLYINVEQITDFYDIVTNGVVVKGMPAWDKRLGDKERMVVAAYAASLRGTTPANPIPPEPESKVIPPFPPTPEPTEQPPGHGG